MKWFKTMSDNLDDPFVFDLVDRFGGDGYLAYFGILSIMAKEFDINSPGTCRVSVRFLTKKLQLSRQKVVKFTKLFHEKGKVFSEIHGDEITLNCPKLKEFCDEWTAKQLRSNSGQTPAQEEEEEYTLPPDKENKFSDDDMKCAVWMFDLISQLDRKTKTPNLEKWAETIRLMRERDDLAHKEICEVFRWANSDSFWKVNILSPDKLRDKFTQLRLKMNNPPTQRAKSKYDPAIHGSV